jgi:hypothetical protein
MTNTKCLHATSVRDRSGDLVCKECGLVLNERARNAFSGAFRDFELVNGFVPRAVEKCYCTNLGGTTWKQ